VVPLRVWWLLAVGLLLNAPLIFEYPFLVQYSGLSLGWINFLLHSNLSVAWGLQAFGFSALAQTQVSAARKGLLELTRC
jgi:hypothetical protein